MLTVLMSADTVGGVWTYALELARSLQPHGVRFVIAALGGLLSPAQRAEAAGVPGLEVYESSLKLEWMDEPWEDVRRAGDWLLELEQRLTPDLVHLNGYAHASLPFRAPVVVAGHSCVLSWWRAVKDEGAPAAWRRYREEVSRGLTAAARVVCPSRAMLDALIRQYGPIEHGCVIPNARSQGLFAPAQKEPFVFAAGRLWDEAKNIATLAQAARGLAWPVRIAGETRHPSGGETCFDGVEFLGRLACAEVAQYAGRAAIYALPARYEPFGLSILEAALSGCALVLGDIPSLRELWDGAAVFAAPADGPALHRTLASLITDRDLRTSLQYRARRRALDFSPGRMAAGYLSLYSGLVRENVCAS